MANATGLLALLATAALTAGTGQALAGTTLDASPATASAYQIGGPGSQADIAIWGQSAQAGESISVLVGSLDGSKRTIHAVLLENNTSNPVATGSFKVGSFASPADFTPVTVFSDLTLPADDYGLVLFNDDTSGDTEVFWSLAGAVNNTADATYAAVGYSVAPDTDVSAPQLSNFTPVYDPLGLTLTAAPEPGPWSLMLLGFGGVGATMRAARRKRSIA